MRTCCCGTSLRLMCFSCDLSIVRSLLAVACHCNCTKGLVQGESASWCGHWNRRLVHPLFTFFCNATGRMQGGKIRVCDNDTV